MEPLHIFLLIGCGFIAGVINVIAGSGSALTMPALMFAGLDATSANASNRVAVLTQGFVGTTGFMRRGINPIGNGLRALPALVPGAIIGGLFAASLPAEVVRFAFGIIFVALLLIVGFRPQLFDTPKPEVSNDGALRVLATPPLPLTPKTHALLFAIGLYGAMFQAAVGIPLLIVMIRLLGLELLPAMAAKNALVLVLTAVALAIFQGAGQVNWLAGGLVAIGSAAGGLVGVRVAFRMNPMWVRRVVLVGLSVAALKAFGLL